MMRETTGLRALQDFFAASQSLWTAELDLDAAVVRATPAFEEAVGGSLVGQEVVMLVCPPQRHAFALLLGEVGMDGWTSGTFSLCVAGEESRLDDRVLHLRAHADGVLLVAEPADRRRDQLLHQVLALNDDLIAAQRQLAERTYELEEARDEAERAADRQRTLATIAAAGVDEPDPDEVVRLLLEQACRVVGGDRSTLLVVDDDRRHIVILDRHAEDADAARGYAIPLGEGVSGEVAVTGRPRIVGDVAAEQQVLRPSGVTTDASLAVVPLRVGAEVAGVLHVGSDRRDAFDEDDVLLLQAIADRAASALAHAQAVAREHRIAETFQRSLLPASLPVVGDLRVVARYRAAAAAARVGGDWYDALALEDGRVAVVIGDVAGKGLPAAVTMGQVRSALRALALDAPGPADVLRRLDPFVAELETMATVFYALVDPAAGTVDYARGGHLPAVLRAPGGAEAVLLEDGLSPPLGFGRVARTQARVALPVGAQFVACTDGLIERRQEDLGTGLEALRRACSDPAVAAADLCDHLLEAFASAGGRYEDDVAIITAALG